MKSFKIFLSVFLIMISQGLSGLDFTIINNAGDPRGVKVSGGGISNDEAGHVINPGDSYKYSITSWPLTISVWTTYNVWSKTPLHTKIQDITYNKPAGYATSAIVKPSGNGSFMVEAIYPYTPPVKTTK